MNEQSLEEKIGINREGKVLKGPWFVPLLFLCMTPMIVSYYWVPFWNFNEFVNETLDSLKFQFETVTKLALVSLVPGLAGLIYRRAFWNWFLTAFVVLFLINAVLISDGKGVVETVPDSNVSLGTYLAIELLLIQLLLAWRLRWHSTVNIDSRKKVIHITLAAILIFGVIGIGYFGYTNVDGVGDLFGSDTVATTSAGDVISENPLLDDLRQVYLLIASQMIITIIILLPFAIFLLASVASAVNPGTTAKNIVVCLDGTWNEPGTTDFGYLAETNVFKLFNLVKGTTSRKQYNASQCKEYLDDKQVSKQIAFYYHGVGNKFENSNLGQLFGGVFGMGAEAIIQRAYLDVTRVYRPGDRIFIFGFSRGAAIARVLAGTIGRRGVPKSQWTLRLFGRHWLVWKSSKKFEDVPIEVLGCWDTVGAFGIAKNVLGIPFQKINLLKNLDVSLGVKRAYHMLALDEARDSFEPTLMDPDPTTPDRIIEVWFSGNHANVGGGYATDKLSNVTLDFLLRHISSGYAYESGMEPGDESWGLYLSAIKKGQPIDGEIKDVPVIEPDSLGRIRQATGIAYSYVPRKVPIDAVIHDSVFERMKGAIPVYAPQSLFNVNEELIKKREEIQTEAKKLVETGSLQDEEFKSILAWSQENMTLIKWSKCLNSKLDEQFTLQDKLRSAEQLPNPPMLLLEE